MSHSLSKLLIVTAAAAMVAGFSGGAARALPLKGISLHDNNGARAETVAAKSSRTTRAHRKVYGRAATMDEVYMMEASRQRPMVHDLSQWCPTCVWSTPGSIATPKAPEQPSRGSRR